MKNKFLMVVCTAASIALTPIISWAEESAPQRLGKQALFSRLDINGDGKISPQEFQDATGKFHQKRRANHMQRMDVDKDNAISLNEFKHWHENMHQQKGGSKKHHGNKHKKPGAHGFEQRWEKADINKDGKVERAEMLSVLTEKVNKIFDHKDRNKDGVITKDELVPPTVDERFANHDTNNDGKIDQAEMDKFRDEMSQKRFEMKDANGDGFIDINEFGRDRKGRHGDGFGGRAGKGMMR